MYNKWLKAVRSGFASLLATAVLVTAVMPSGALAEDSAANIPVASVSEDVPWESEGVRALPPSSPSPTSWNLLSRLNRGVGSYMYPAFDVPITRLSSDERYMAFMTYALDDDLGLGRKVIGIQDRSTGELQVVPTPDVTGSVLYFDMTPDARYFAYTYGEDAVSGITKVFLYDRGEGRLETINDVSGPNDIRYEDGDYVSVSDDGRYVAFDSDAPLVPLDTNEERDVYLYDRLASGEKLERISKPLAEFPNNDSWAPSISGDGSVIAFVSKAQLAGDRDEGWDTVYLYNRTSGSVKRVAEGRAPSISGDGRFVAFSTHRQDLVAGDTNGRDDIYVYDDAEESFLRASMKADGSEHAWNSRNPSISRDGAYVAYEVGENGSIDALEGYVTGIRDLTSAKIIVPDSPLEQGTAAMRPSIGDGGRTVTFLSSYMERIGDIKFKAFDYFVATNGTAPAWPAGSKLSASNIGPDQLTVSWPSAGDEDGVTGYAVYRNGKPVGYVPGSVTSYTMTDQLAGTSLEDLVQVEAIDGGHHMSMDGPTYAWVRDGEVDPPDELLYFDWIGERGSDSDPLLRGSSIQLYASGPSGRDAKAEYSYLEWDGDNEIPKSASVKLDELRGMGLYVANFRLSQQTTELMAMRLTMTAAGESLTKEADNLPVSIGGSLALTFVGAEQGELKGSILTILQSDSEVRTLTLGDLPLTSIDGLQPGEPTTIVLYTPDYRHEMARVERIGIQSGRTSSVAVPIEFPARLRVKMVDAGGKPVAGIPVSFWNEERQLLNTSYSDDDGVTAWQEGLVEGETLTADIDLADIEYELAPNASLSMALERGDNELAIRLVQPDRGELVVTVLNPAGEPVYDAMVTASQTYKGKPVVVSGRTTFDGRTRLDLYEGEAVLEATQAGFRYSSDRTIVQVEAETSKSVELPVRQPDKYTVNLNVFKKALDTGWLGPLNLNDEWFLATVSSYPGGGWVRSYFSNAVSVGGNPGNKVEACLEGSIYAYVRACGSSVLDENLNADIEVRLEEKGARIQGLVETGRHLSYYASIYESMDNGGKRWVADALNTDFQSRPFNVNVPKGGTFRMEIVKTVREANYTSRYETASVEFTIAENEVKDLGTIAFNASSQFANKSGNSFTAYPSRAVPGSMLVLKAAYRNVTEKTVENAYLHLDIPEGMALVTDSAGGMAVTGGAGTAELQDGVLRVPLGNLAKRQEGTVTYKLAVAPTFNKASVSAAARLRADLDGKSLEETLGTVQLDAPRITLEAPDRISGVDRRTVLSGFAPAGSAVHLYDTDIRIGGAVANAAGMWKTEATLVDLGNSSMHALWAETEKSGVALRSEKVFSEYDESLPRLERVAYSQAPAGRWISVQVGSNAPDLPYTVLPGYPFLFDMEFSEPDRVENVRVYMEGQEGVEAVPAVREGSIFRAIVPITADALGGIYVDYDVKKEQRFYDGHLEDLDEIRASMPLGMRDFEVVAVEPFRLKGDTYVGNAALRFPQLGGATLSFSITVDPSSDYVPTEEEQELALRSGVPVVQKTFDASETDTSMILKLRGYIPSDLLEEDGGSPLAFKSSLAGKPGDWKHTAEYFMEIKADVDGVKGQIDSVKSQYNDYMTYAGKINKIMHRVEASGMDCLQEMPTTAKEAGKALAAVVIGEVAKTAMSAGVGAMALTGVGGVIAGKVSSMASSRIDNYVDEKIDAVGSGYNECNSDDKKKYRGLKVASPKWIYDPSGYVYEAVASNPVEGVTATVVYQDEASGEWEVWKAEEYEQVNPQLTDQAGKYGWDVPPGKWKVVWSKAGYETVESAEMDVPPPHTEVNAGMISRAAPEVTAVQGFAAPGGSYVEVTLSKYLKTSELPAGGIVLLDRDSKPVEGRAEFAGLEASAANEGVMLSRTLRFVPKGDLALDGEYRLKLGKGVFVSYANAMLADKDAKAHPVVMKALDLTGPLPISATTESGGRVIRITFDEAIQGIADAAGMLLDGTNDVVTTAVSATKQGESESRELLLTLRAPVLEEARLTLLAGAVKDGQGNASAEAAFTLSPDINPSLKELSFASGSLSPAFSPAVTEYALALPAGTNDVTLKATALQEGTKLTIGSEPAVSGLAKIIPIPEDGVITVRLDAGGGVTLKKYTVKVSYSGGGGEPAPGPDPGPDETPKPGNPLDVGRTARVVSKTSSDGRIVLTAEIAAEAVKAALSDGRKGQVLYLEPQEHGDELVVRVPAVSVKLMKEAGASLLVRSPMLDVTVDASEALAGSELTDGAVFALVLESAPDEWRHKADEAAQAQSHGIKRLTSPIRVKANWISDDKAEAAIPVSNGALKGRFGKSADAYRFDEASGVWVFFAEAGRKADSSFVIATRDYYAGLKPALGRFKDTAGHWAKPDIEWMTRRLLVNGTSNVLFSPDASVTRAEFTALLARALQLPASDGDNGNHAEHVDNTDNASNIDNARNGGIDFVDVAPTAWYREYVLRAVAAGIVKGHGAGRFAPDATISRQEMAVMISRAYSYLDLAASPSGGGLNPAELFTDGSLIQSWARDAVALAVGEGLLKGVSKGRFEPTGLTTRAQAAVVLKRLLNKLEE